MIGEIKESDHAFMLLQNLGRKERCILVTIIQGKEE